MLQSFGGLRHWNCRRIQTQTQEPWICLKKSTTWSRGMGWLRWVKKQLFLTSLLKAIEPSALRAKIENERKVRGKRNFQTRAQLFPLVADMYMEARLMEVKLGTREMAANYPQPAQWEDPFDVFLVGGTTNKGNVEAENTAFGYENRQMTTTNPQT